MIKAADAISKLLDDPELGIAMGLRGAELARKQYTWVRVASQMKQLYAKYDCGQQSTSIVSSRINNFVKKVIV